MSTQVLSTTQHSPETALGAADDAPGAVSTATGGTLSALDAFSNNISIRAKVILDRFSTPEQREALLVRIKTFMLANPEVSAVLGMNIALTGIPLGLFTLFGLSVAVCSVLGGIIIGLLGAALFTLFCVGIALTIVFPILMFTTASACFLFLFGFVGYKILRWASGRDKDSKNCGDRQDATTVSDSLNASTGGRLGRLLNSAASERDKNDTKGFSDEKKNSPRQPQTPRDSKNQAEVETAKPDTGKVMNSNAPATPITPAVNNPVEASPVSPMNQKRRADEKRAAATVEDE